MKKNLEQLIEYNSDPKRRCYEYISQDKIEDLTTKLRKLLFPGYFEKMECDIKNYMESLYNEIEALLTNEIKYAFSTSKEKVDVEIVVENFLASLPCVLEYLNTDIDALIEGDPAVNSRDEIILCYPGILAITVYRLANVLYKLNVPLIPRIMSEYAHSKTGIDINPGATIGKYFYIDHGTGVVIGETCIIGEHVKVYQGVTLGAISLRKGSALHGVKRHPTIKNYVTIYSGASILGGETIIGDNVTIGSSVFVTSSIEDNKIVTLKSTETTHI